VLEEAPDELVAGHGLLALAVGGAVLVAKGHSGIFLKLGLVFLCLPGHRLGCGAIIAQSAPHFLPSVNAVPVRWRSQQHAEEPMVLRDTPPEGGVCRMVREIYFLSMR
jgi:hypothetical protein